MYRSYKLINSKTSKQTFPSKMGSASSSSRPPSAIPPVGGEPKSSPQTQSTSKDKTSKDSQNKKAQKMSIAGQANLDTDVMISYSHNDKVVMNKLKEGLESRGIKVWVDVIGLQAGVDFLSKIGQAIIDSKLFIPLISRDQVNSKYCQDELALAYVSSKPIFPVALLPADDLFPIMDTGMKLQLARFHWHLFTNEDRFEEDMDKLVRMMKDKLTELSKEENGSNGDRRKNLTKRQSSRSLFNRESQPQFVDMFASVSENLDERMKKSFWDRHFLKQDQVKWQTFLEKFNEDYKDSLKSVFNANDRHWLISVLHRELQVEEDIVTRLGYVEFCTVDGEGNPFWSRVQDQAVESYTVREVFNMESSVRVEAIENLGKFHSDAVVEALLDLLTDDDYNVRAVAAISLARTGANSRRVIQSLMKCLNQKDRLVRESACLALGHLKAEAAVDKIVQLWRNDFISSVREAAQVALEQIGGEEAQKAMHITKVLSEEIRHLTKD